MSRTVMSVVLASVVGFSASAFAEQSTGFYVGAEYGVVKLPSEDGLNFSNPKNGALDFGYSFSENWAIEAQVSQSLTDGTSSTKNTEDMTSELRNSLISNGYTSQQAVQTVKSATLTTTAKADASVDTYGVFGVYRTSGPLYAKFKAGFLSVKTTVDISVAKADLIVVNSSNASSTLSANDVGLDLDDYDQSFSDSETKFAYGIGGGYKISEKFSVELEYTKLTDDLDSYSVSAKYHF